MYSIGSDDVIKMNGNPETNLVEFSDFIKGFIASDGQYNNSSGNGEMTSDYAPATAGKYYTFNYDARLKTDANYWCAIAFYGENKQFIIRYGIGEQPTYSQAKYLAPANTKYVRASARFLVGASWAKIVESES